MIVQTSGLRSLAPEAIAVNGFNPRKAFGESDLRELALSFQNVGVLQPLIVRRVGEGYELVAGERRLRASKLARLAEVPCLVRELTDAQALEVAVLENLQRRDITALEEAEGFQRLIDAGQYTPDTLAEKLSKSREHVYGRLRLCKVADVVRESLESGEVDASVAGLLAKFPVPLQKPALKSLRDRRCLSFRQAKDLLSDMWHPLGNVPWRAKKTGAELPELVAGCGACGALACSDCPRNSRNMPDMVGLHKAKEVCTDAVCYGEKLDLWGELQLARCKTEGRVVVELARDDWDYSGEAPAYSSGWELADQEKYGFGSDWTGGLTWRVMLEGTGYVFPLAQSPSGKLVDLVKPSEARALLIERGKLKPQKSAGRSAAPAERKAVIAENRQKRAATAALAAVVLEKVSGMDDAEFWPLAFWQLDRDWGFKRTLAAELGKDGSHADDDLPEDEWLGASLAALGGPERRQMMVKAHLWRRKEWEPGYVEALAEALRVSVKPARKGVVKTVGSLAEIVADHAASASASVPGSEKIIAAAKARWAKIKAEASSKRRKGKAKAS